jgi:hypothetical protein
LFGRKRWLALLAAALASFGALGSAETMAAQKVGVAAAIQNDVQGSSGGAAQKLAPGSQLFEQEVVKTGPDSLAQLIFLDETSLSVGPKAQVKLDKFVFDPNRKAGSVILSASKGAFRFVDGAQDPRNYTIKTPVATIGVQGTIVDCYVFAAGLVCIVEDGIAKVGGHTVKAGQAILVSANGSVHGPLTPDGTLFALHGHTPFPLYGQELGALVAQLDLGNHTATDITNQIKAIQTAGPTVTARPPSPPPPPPPTPPCIRNCSPG